MVGRVCGIVSLSRIVGLIAFFWLFQCNAVRADIISGVQLTGTFSGASSSRGNDGFAFSPTTNLLVSSLGYFDWNSDGLVAAHAVGIYRHDPSALGTVIYNVLNPSSPAPNDEVYYYSDFYDPEVGKYYDENGHYDGPAKEGIAFYYPGSTYTPGAAPSLVAEVAFNPGEGTLDGGFRYKDISPVMLFAGERYTIAGFHPGGPGAADDRLAFANSANFATSPELGYVGYGYNFQSDLSPLRWEKTDVSEYSFIEWGVQYDFPREIFDTSFNPFIAYFGPNLQFSAVPEPSSFIMVLGLGSLLIHRSRRRLDPFE